MGEIHQILKEKFGFHDFYGENWDALWDLMYDVFKGSTEYHIEIYGYNNMENDLREECKNMIEVFDDVNKEAPNFTYEIIS